LGCQVTSANLPRGLDPAKLLTTRGADTLLVALDQTRVLADELTDRHLAGWARHEGNALAEVDAVRSTARVIAGMAPRDRRRQIQRLAERYVVDAAEVRALVKEHATSHGTGATGPPDRRRTGQASGPGHALAHLPRQHLRLQPAPDLAAPAPGADRQVQCQPADGAVDGHTANPRVEAAAATTSRGRR
jgi:hypothetical protein